MRHTEDGLQIAFAISRKLMASTDDQISISHPGIRLHSSFQLRKASCGRNEDNARFMSLVSSPQLDRDAEHLPEPAVGLLVNVSVSVCLSFYFTLSKSLHLEIYLAFLSLISQVSKIRKQICALDRNTLAMSSFPQMF